MRTSKNLQTNECAGSSSHVPAKKRKYLCSDDVESASKEKHEWLAHTSPQRERKKCNVEDIATMPVNNASSSFDGQHLFETDSIEMGTLSCANKVRSVDQRGLGFGHASPIIATGPNASLDVMTIGIPFPPNLIPNVLNRTPDKLKFISKTLPPPISEIAKRSTSNNGIKEENTLALSSTRKNISKKSSPRLTLSAFRRPETAVRLTNSDWSRKIETEYDLKVGGRHGQGQILGHGASSTVRLALRRSDGVRVAVKCIPKHEILRDYRRMDEYLILQGIDHPNIVRLHKVYETESELFLVMDFCSGGDLYARVDELGRFPEKKVKFIIFRLLKALSYLHDLGIVHRDVKPENVLLVGDDDCSVKLADFGLAKRIVCSDGAARTTSSQVPRALVVGGSSVANQKRCFSSDPASPLKPLLGRRRSRAYSRVGSDYYSAPEVNSGGGYDTAVDMYSLGVCAHVLLTGSTPPVSLSLVEEDAPRHPSDHWRGASVEARELIKSLLSFNPDDRPSASNAIEHSWFRDLPLTERDNINSTRVHQRETNPTMKTSDTNALSIPSRTRGETVLIALDHHRQHIPILRVTSR